jgi:hypothetical protein
VRTTQALKLAAITNSSAKYFIVFIAFHFKFLKFENDPLTKKAAAIFCIVLN